MSKYLRSLFYDASPLYTLICAEDEGFEPSIGCPIHAFQACALGRYANPPIIGPGATGQGYRC